jgi:hypothetical protein
MERAMNVGWILAGCLGGPLVLAGLVVLGLKIAAIIQKASEPPTVDESGDYTLDQGRDVGKDP